MKEIRNLPFFMRGFVLFVMSMTLVLTNGCRSENTFSTPESNSTKSANSTLVVKNEQAFLAGLSEGLSLTIDAEVFIQGQQVDAPSWTAFSEDESIAKVDNTLKVTAVSPGETYINIQHKDLKGKLKVVVTNSYIDSVQITPSDVSLFSGFTTTLTSSATLSNGQTVELDNDLVSWTSSDPGIAPVNDQGVVEGLKVGNVTVTASLISEPSKASSSTVTVSEAVINSIQVTPSTISLIDGHTATLTASAILDGRTVTLNNQLVTWTSSDDATAMVNDQGVVEGQDVGTAAVTATLKSDPSKTSSSVITVSEAVIDSIQVTPSTVSLIDGHTETLTASATLSDGRTVALDTTLVTWASSDVATAVVNNQGVVKGQDVGNTTVTATLISNPSKSSSSSITVTAAVLESIQVTPSTLSLSIGDTETLSVSAIFSDGRATALDNSALTWSSAEPSITTVNSDGVVKAIASGSTTIDVTYRDLPTVNVEINVLQNIRMLSLNPERVLVNTGGTFQLEVKAILDDGSLAVLDNKLITWNVADASVALVDSDGMVQGVSDGNTQISATYQSFSETTDVIVSDLVKEMQSSVDIAVGVPFQWRAIYTNANDDRIEVTKQASWSTYFDSSKGENKANELVSLATKGQYRVDELGQNNGYASDIVYTYNGDVTKVAVNSYTSRDIKSMPECSTKQPGELGMCRTKSVGGNGGGPQPIASCPLGSVATGLVFKHTTKAVWGGLGIQLKCSSVSLDLNNQLVFKDNDKESLLVHGGDHPKNTTDTYTSQCSQGSIISSIRTSANNVGILDDFQLGCSPVSYDALNSRYIVNKENEKLLPWQRSGQTNVQVTEFLNNVGLSAIAVKAGAALDSTVFVASDLSMSVAAQ